MQLTSCILPLFVVASTAISGFAWTPSAIADERLRASDVLAEQARKSYDAGDFERAATLYWEAWRSEPRLGDYLYSAARSSHKAGRWQDAVDRYRMVLQRAETVTPDRVTKTKAFLAEAESELAAGAPPAVAGPAPEPSPVASAPQAKPVRVEVRQLDTQSAALPPAQSVKISSAWPWWVAGGGAVLAGVGGGLVGEAYSAETTLWNETWGYKQRNEAIQSWTYSGAQSQAEALAVRKSAGAALVASGALTVLTGLAWKFIWDSR